MSTGNIRKSQFVGSLSGRVAILSGMHGGPDRNLFAEFNGVQRTQLLNEDIFLYGRNDSIMRKVCRVR